MTGSDRDAASRSLARYPAAAVGLTALSLILIKTGRDTLFFHDHELQQLPLAYLWTAAAALPAAMMHLAAMGRWGLRRTRTSSFVLAAALFLVWAPALATQSGTVMTVFFAVVPTVFAALFAGAWLLTGDLLDDTGADVQAWAYSRVGGAAMLGGVAGGACARGLAVVLAPHVLVAVGALVLVLVAGVLHRAHRLHPALDGGATDASDTRAHRHPPGLIAAMARNADLMRQPYVRTMLGISGLAALVGLYVEFQFYATAVTAGHTSGRFFADFYLILNAVALGLQLLVAPALQARWGVGGALLLLPTALLGSASILSLSATIQARIITKVTEGGLKSAFHRAIWEQAFLPIAGAQRGIAKTLVDGLAARLAEGAGAAGLYLWLTRLARPETPSLGWISGVILLALVGWIGLTRRLRRIGCADVVANDALIRLPEGCPVASSLGRRYRR